MRNLREALTRGLAFHDDEYLENLMVKNWVQIEFCKGLLPTGLRLS